jgi:hypothetical protein
MADPWEREDSKTVLTGLLRRNWDRFTEKCKVTHFTQRVAAGRIEVRRARLHVMARCAKQVEW